MQEHRATIGMLAGAAGGAVAIGLMEAFSTRAAIPLMAIPFATSIVLVMVRQMWKQHSLAHLSAVTSWRRSSGSWW